MSVCLPWEMCYHPVLYTKIINNAVRLDFFLKQTHILLKVCCGGMHPTTDGIKYLAVEHLSVNPHTSKVR